MRYPSCVGDSAVGHDRYVLGSRKTAPSVIHTVARTSCQVSCGFVCSCRFPLFVMINGCLCKFAWWLICYCADICLLLWTKISRVHSSVDRAADCRSAGPWFNSGWKSWFTFMTCSDNPMNQISQMFISKSPITRKSVKRRSGQSDVPVKQRGGWPKISSN